MGADVGGGDVDGADAMGFHMDDAVLYLQCAFDVEEARARNEDAFALEEVGGDDDVGNAGFVFHGEEDEAFGGAGALTGNYASGGADEGVAGGAGEVVGGEVAAQL